MANCCDITQKNFNNEEVTSLAWVGERPKVKVVYLDPDSGVWGYSNPLTRIEIFPGVINVDHGGPATGIIQLIQ